MGSTAAPLTPVAETRFPRDTPDGDRAASRPTTTLRVEYCELGNYRLAAERLLRAVKGDLPEAQIVAQLEPRRGGVFEVSVGGRLVYSKRATQRLPEAEEILYHVGAALTR